MVEMLIRTSAANTSARTAATSFVRKGSRRSPFCRSNRYRAAGLHAATRRRRSVTDTAGSGGGFAQHVADPAQRVDQPRLHVVHLAPQIRDVRLDDVVVTTEVVLPHVVED